MKPVVYLAACLMLIPPWDSRGQLIDRAEYFFDTDPGTGNGISIPIAAGDPLTFAASIPTTGLGPGVHYLFVRTRTEGYKWSHAEPRLIEVASIVEAEYFVDTDPGVGNGTAIPVADGVLNFTVGLDISGLPDGAHSLVVRTRQETGRWSVSEPRYFYILTRVMTAEYFIDADPGPGNGSPLAVGTPASLVNFSPSLNVGALADGSHHLMIRTKDALGIWSMFEALPFTVDAALPIELTQFRAVVIHSNRVRLEWTTAAEVNNDYFTVQHSTDGAEFRTLAQVTAAGNSTSVLNYDLVHTDPSPGVNYYRLKQTDFDGSSTYSRIVSAEITGKAATTVFPNPASHEWYVSYGDEGTHRVEVFDMVGRKCLDVFSENERSDRFLRADLPAGAYLVKVTTGDGTVVIRKLILD